MESCIPLRSETVNFKNSTWTNNRADGTGPDIWANVLDWENPTLCRLSDVNMDEAITPGDALCAF